MREGHCSVFEKLLEPTVKDRRVEVMLLAKIRHRHLVHQMASQDLNFHLRGVVFPLSLGRVLLHLGTADSNGGGLDLRQRQDTIYTETFR